MALLENLSNSAPESRRDEPSDPVGGVNDEQAVDGAEHCLDSGGLGFFSTYGLTLSVEL